MVEEKISSLYSELIVQINNPFQIKSDIQSAP